MTAIVNPVGSSQSVTWTSSNESVATVNITTGKVIGIAEGTAIITATCVVNSNIKSTCDVIITKGAPRVVWATGNIGTGDPCKYYLKGTWRLPTSTEYDKLFVSEDDWTWSISSNS